MNKTDMVPEASRARVRWTGKWVIIIDHGKRYDGKHGLCMGLTGEDAMGRWCELLSSHRSRRMVRKDLLPKDQKTRL